MNPTQVGARYAHPYSHFSYASGSTLRDHGDVIDFELFLGGTLKKIRRGCFDELHVGVPVDFLGLHLVGTSRSVLIRGI